MIRKLGFNKGVRCGEHCPRHHPRSSSCQVPEDQPMRRMRFTVRRGQTLLELVGATTVIAIALVPALRIMRDCIRLGRNSETANLMSTLSTSKLEEHLVSTAANWNATTDAGGFTGYPTLRDQVVKTDEGVGSGLMNITSRVWEDTNGNQTWDAGELGTSFATKLARNVAYQLEASSGS